MAKISGSCVLTHSSFVKREVRQSGIACELDEPLVADLLREPVALGLRARVAPDERGPQHRAVFVEAAAVHLPGQADRGDGLPRLGRGGERGRRRRRGRHREDDAVAGLADRRAAAGDTVLVASCGPLDRSLPLDALLAALAVLLRELEPGVSAGILGADAAILAPLLNMAPGPRPKGLPPMLADSMLGPAVLYSALVRVLSGLAELRTGRGRRR